VKALRSTAPFNYGVAQQDLVDYGIDTRDAANSLRYAILGDLFQLVRRSHSESEWRFSDRGKPWGLPHALSLKQMAALVLRDDFQAGAHAIGQSHSHADQAVHPEANGRSTLPGGLCGRTLWRRSQCT